MDASADQIKDYWYRFDAVNRVVTQKGIAGERRHRARRGLLERLFLLARAGPSMHWTLW